MHPIFTLSRLQKERFSIRDDIICTNCEITTEIFGIILSVIIIYQCLILSLLNSFRITITIPLKNIMHPFLLPSTEESKVSKVTQAAKQARYVAFIVQGGLRKVLYRVGVENRNAISFQVEGSQ